MVLVNYVKFSLVFIFCKIREKKCVLQYFGNKRCFQDYKNEKLKKSKNGDLSKGVSPLFWSKM